MAGEATGFVWDVTADDELDDVLTELRYSNENEVEAVHGRSRPERAGNFERNRKRYAMKLHQDYFCSSPTYPEYLFERRFRVSNRILFKLCDCISAHNRYFAQTKDCTG